MANLLVIENFPASNIVEQSNLTADTVAGLYSIVVENPDGFVADDYALLGVKGSESGQILKISSVTGTTITFYTALTVSHYRNEPIYKLIGNQAKIYRATNVDGSIPSDASFSLLVTVSYQGDQVNTSYNDSAGGVTYWYKYTNFNATSLAETPLADAMPIRGGNYGYYASADDVREEAGFSNNRYITDQITYDKLIKAQAEVNASLLIGGYTLPLGSPYPEVVSHAVILLAAGYLLTMDYGPEHSGTNKDGTLKIKQARDILAKLESGDTPLIDGAGGVSVTQTSKVRGYPDETAENASPSEARMFSITDRY